MQTYERKHIFSKNNLIKNKSFGKQSQRNQKEKYNLKVRSVGCEQKQQTKITSNGNGYGTRE